MADEGKADWEIRLEKYFEQPVSEAKVDGTFSGSQLQSLLIDIEKTVGEAKKFLAANMVSEVRAQLNKIRVLLTFLESRASESVEEVASLLKAGVSEKVLKEIYGVTEEIIQKAKKHLETTKKESPIKWIVVHNHTVVFETSNYEEAVKKFYELQKEKGWYPPALAIFKRETASSHSNPNRGVEQKTRAESNSIVTAAQWRTLSTKEILDSVDIATRVLKDRTLTSEEKRFAGELAKDLVEISLDPEEEEEEYERVRERASRVRAERLLF
ncbi:hypothetical protein KEJ15_04050 [Candidatus Bathyarchaeota archaeon]|nr:hypothetical protein [Candidatus Bathyarchaeota archaeon]